MLLEPEQRVLSTLQADGSRRWLRPRLSRGRFWSARRWVAYALIVLFTAVPYIRFQGKPLVLLDVVNREFTVFGFTFLPTDTVLLALFVLGGVLSIFLLTALFGRVWCGWMCPQTVYMEYVFRPIERLFEGTVGRGGEPKRGLAGWRKIARFAVYLIVSMYLAHTFLVYFVGVDALRRWVLGSPLDHPVAFGVMIATVGLMMFDFGFFREQMCILACPYGRLQSVLLDRRSLIVGYDEARGEPRGKRKRGEADGSRGDCVDCGLCAAVCPTGIDIRDGLQMECIGCAQCIDACDGVMTKLGLPTGLIRYGSQASMSGAEPKRFRPRLVFYPLLLALVGGLFVWALMGKDGADVTVLRNHGNPFTVLASGEVSNNLRLKITNRTREAVRYDVAAVGRADARLAGAAFPLRIAPGESKTEGVLVILPRRAFAPGVVRLNLRVTGDDGFEREIECRLLGPVGGGA